MSGITSRLVIGWFVAWAIGPSIAAEVTAIQHSRSRETNTQPGTGSRRSDLVAYQTTPAKPVWSVPDRPGNKVGSPRQSTGLTSIGDENLDPGRDWRYTRAGWQLVELAKPRRSHLIQLPPLQTTFVHPLNIAALTVLGVLALTSWASNEWDWCRFVRDVQTAND